jgi:tRNA U34 2-thiouridine synthase MnmA/TrmU
MASDHKALPPLPFRWTGDGFEPIGRFKKLADETFVVGQLYRLVEHQDRSQVSHSHFFAVMNEAWQQLPEHLAERFPDPDSLRKYALCRTGYAEIDTVVCPSKAMAVTLMKQIARRYDYAAIDRQDGTSVMFFTALSQSHRAMGAKKFQESKQSCLDFVASLIGVGADELAKQAGRAA